MDIEYYHSRQSELKQDVVDVKKGIDESRVDPAFLSVDCMLMGQPVDMGRYLDTMEKIRDAKN